MSGSRRGRDAIAPSLFPFLAVLLCTMGSLVLILMLIVSNAQATTRQVTEQTKQKTEELQATIVLAQSSYRRQLEEGRIDLEKKRLALQHFEEHILELLEELEDMSKTAELLNQTVAATEEEQQQLDQQISELERQLAEATKELQQQVDEPDGDKPIFAVIPYEGTHGTHRRPIYLECVERGLIIQPEGILIPSQDLQPPHGPGNPLDAALRTIRAEFEPANGAVTRTAYPLLIVRPSGVRNYTLARSAMSGWDDQFGYELIENEMELTYPESKPGLEQKIVQTLRLARERQTALAMAMPRKYRAFVGGSSVGGSGSTANGSRYGNPLGTGGLGHSGTMSTIDGQRQNSLTIGGQGSGTASWEQALGDTSRSVPGASMLGAGSASAFPQGDYVAPSASEFENFARSNPSYAGVLRGDHQAGNGPFRSGMPDAGMLGAGIQGTESRGSNLSWNDPSNTQSSFFFQNKGSESTSSSTHSNFQGSSSNSPSASSSSRSSRGAQDGFQNSSLAQSSPSQSSGSATSSSYSGTSFSIPGISIDAPNGGAPSSGQHTRRDSSSAPVAQTRGRNWAWSQGPPTQTPVVRSVHLHCFSDRWILLPEDGNPDRALSIEFDNTTPHVRAERLAKAVLDRVDSWGLALDGGYWKPIVLVDVARNAAWRFDQLRQLMEGSGLEVRLRE